MMTKDAASSFLTEEEVKNIENTTLRAPDRDLTYAQVFYLKQLDNPWAESGSYYVADTDEGGAELLRTLSQAKRIFVSGQKVTYSVYTEGIGWELKFSEISAARSWGRPIDTEVIARATRAAQVKMNSLAYLGDVTFGVVGLMGLSGVTAITGTLISGMTDPASSFIGYFNSLPVVYRTRYPYKLVMADQEWKLLQKRGNTYNDKSIATILTEAIPNLTIVPPEVCLDAATAYWTGSAAGTVPMGVAFLVPTAPDPIRLPVAMSPTTTRMEYTDTQEVKGVVYARAGTLEAPFPTSVGKITGLSA